MFKNYRNLKNGTFVALVAGVLLWLGLSPRIATRLYEAVLMPRVRCERIGMVKSTAVSSVQFQSNGTELEGVLYRQPGAEKIVLFCGGRRSNLTKLAIPAEELLKTGVSVFVFEYRGFGNAVGRATLLSLLQDGLCAYDALLSLGYSAENIVIYGESLGAAVAANVSERRAASGLVLQSGFSSLERQVKDMFPILGMYPAAMYPQTRLASDQSLKRGHPPLLIIHGDRDEIINLAHAHRLAAAAGNNTTLAILAGAGHLVLQTREDWFQAVSTFLGSL
jgi:uncharacterized protein